MWGFIKNTLRNTFFQLFTIYTVCIILIALGFFWKYTLHFEIFALIIALTGFFIISDKPDFRLNKKFHYTLLAVAILLILILRIIPYTNSSIPLGYDPGMYKYAIEHGLKNGDRWVYSVMDPLFLYLVSFLHLFLSTDFILITLFIFCNLLLGFSIYICAKEYFGKEAGIIAIFLYAFSLIQFKAYWFMYYRNIVGLSMMLLAIYFLSKRTTIKYRILFIVTAGLLGGMHKPTFYIFGLSYFFYAFIHPYKEHYNFKELKNNIIDGILIIVIFLLLHIGPYFSSIISLINPVIGSITEPGNSPGTFIDFFAYQYSILPYLAVALLGFAYLIKNRQFNILFYYAIINATIVIAKFFFFNRFIIHLDIILILLASLGFVILVKENKYWGLAILLVLMASAGILAFKESINSRPLINENELQTIRLLHTTEKDAFVMCTTSHYSPWIQGYSQRRTIAPGLFDYDNHSRDEWIVFWTTNDTSEIQSFMNVYDKPLYIYIGQRQPDNLAQFPDCFVLIYENLNNRVYRYTC